MIKSAGEQDTGRYLCQNFDQGLSINTLLTILSKYISILFDILMFTLHICYIRPYA